MNKLIVFLLLIFANFGLYANQQSTVKQFNTNKLNNEKGTIHYDLNAIIDTIQKCIDQNKNIKAPKESTEFEKLLFEARRIQHNDSQFVAIEIFNYLLEFEWYRTKGEELYLKLLLANSLDYIGASFLATEYMDEIFPEFLKYVYEDSNKDYFLNHFANRLINIDRIEEANHAYQIIYDLRANYNNPKSIYRARNNLALTSSMLNKNKYAKKLLRINQLEENKSINPILYAFSFGNYGTIMKTERKYDSAIYYGKKEVRLLSESNSQTGLSNTLHMLGECYEELNEIDSAIKYFNKSLDLRLKNNYTDGIVRTARELIELNTKSNNSEEVGILFKLFDSYSDSLNKKNYAKHKKDELQIYNYLEILEQAQYSKQQFDQLTVRNRELNYSLIALALLILTLVAFIINRRIYRLKLVKVNNSLIGKNIELEQFNIELSKSSLKNETLLKELHHRVKNNLQMISSLFNLQMNVLNFESSTAQVFKKAQDRIFSIALVHRKIYQSDEVEKMEFSDYLKDFTNELIKSHTEEVNVKIHIQPVLLSIDAAIPLGLIFNELFTNSLKHARAKSTLEVTISQSNAGKKFIYSDNGVGINPELISHENSASIGITLIDLLSKQLDATIEFREPKEGDYGFYFSIEGNFE